MAEVDLRTATFDDAIKAIRFFNGRLLTAADLLEEQAYHREERKRVGRIAGEGVAQGLEVSLDTALSTPSRPVLSVEPGLAISRSGQPLLVSEKMLVALVDIQPTPGGPPEAFEDCNVDEIAPLTPADGLYLLVISPVSGTGGGGVPASGLASGPATCNFKYATRGFQFKLLPMPANDPEDLLFRNKTAYRCFGYLASGAPELTKPAFDPMALGYGIVDAMRNDPVTNCDVPLAVIHWKSNGVQFVDNWSVRRGITHRDPTGNWRRHLADRRLSEGAAIVLQFQEHLAGLSSSWPSLAANSRFRFLPAAGFLPVGTGKVNWQTFLGSHAPLAITRISAALFRGLLQERLLDDPIDLAASPLAAVDVFGDPALSGFVLFARTRTGRAIVQVNPSNISPAVDYRADGCTVPVCAIRNGNRFQFDARPGSYTFTVQAAGRQSASGSVTTTGGLVESQTITLTAVPQPDPDPKPTEPSRCISIKQGKDIKALALAKLGNPRLCLLLEVGFSEKRKPSRFKLFYEQAPWKGMEEVSHPEIKEWLLSWREYVEKLLREPIAPQNIHFFAGASSTKEILDEPAAFAVFNDVGIPVLLIPPNWAGALRIPLANSSVAEIRAVAGKLNAIGVDDLSMLAALWPQVVADAIEADRRLAAALIADARSEIEELDSKGAFGILDKEAEERFKSRGFSNDASLANMKYEEATTIAGGYTLALKLIQNARNRIPESAWKLDALGFSSPQMDKLFDLGVETQGDWVTLTDDAAGRRKAAAELGVDDEFIDASRQTTAANQTGAVAGKVTLPGIDSVAGVNRAVAAALVKAGISTVDELAATKAEELAAKIGISEPQAALIIKDAKTKTSGLQPIEKLKFSTDIQKQLKELEIHTVDDLLKASITKLTKVFGDKAKAQGVKDGVGRVFGPKK